MRLSDDAVTRDEDGNVSTACCCLHRTMRSPGYELRIVHEAYSDRNAPSTAVENEPITTEHLDL